MPNNPSVLVANNVQITSEIGEWYSLASKYGISPQEIGLIDFNRTGVCLDDNDVRVGFRTRFNGTLFYNNDLSWFALPVRSYEDSNFHIKNGKVFFEKFQIGTIDKPVLDTCDTSIQIGCLLFVFLKPPEEKGLITFPKIPSVEEQESPYSSLTGEKLADASLKTAPTYCIQIPNGTDGARPQSGLNKAGVVFEAIAESGITRFAAIFQNPTTAIIGPIRSLRIYYLEWDTPFDCTIVHAGGSGDALAALANGGYKDLTENYTYMYRGTYGSRLWNNLFTTSSELRQFSMDRGYNTSEIKGFARMTPSESNRARIDALVSEKLEITTPTTANTSEMVAKVSVVGLRFGGWANFNVNYNYDLASNTYLRSYESGVAHEVYNCAEEDLGERNPEDVCTLTQVAPSVVVAMVVSERKASDNYHEDITAIGSGDAYIFQNGIAIRGKWTKSSRDEQIKFTDENGEGILLAPGQTFISAVPSYGSIDF